MTLIRLNTRSLPDSAVTGAKIEANPTVSGNLTAAQKLGVLGTNDLGLGVHIKEGDSGASSVSTDADQLVIENSGESGITLLAGTSSASRLAFGDSGNSKIGMVYYNHASDFMHFSTNDSVKMKIDSTGAVTKPLQPAFMARPSSKLTNIALNQSVGLNFASETFDRNADYNTGSSPTAFTAPITGVYQLSLVAYLEAIDTAATYFQIGIATSNRGYNIVIDPNFSSDLNYYHMTVTLLADMDANDTAHVAAFQSGGTAQTDLDTASIFSGYLVA